MLPLYCDREAKTTAWPFALPVPCQPQQTAVDAGARLDRLSSDEKAELAWLRHGNKQLHLEREILAQAAAWLSGKTDSVPPKPSSSG
jgi:hypothetical protein